MMMLVYLDTDGKPRVIADLIGEGHEDYGERQHFFEVVPTHDEDQSWVMVEWQGGFEDYDAVEVLHFPTFEAATIGLVKMVEKATPERVEATNGC